MKSIFFCIILLSACTSLQKDMSRQAAQEIIKADKAMNDLAIKEGFHKSLLQFADDSLIKPQEGEYPVIGKRALEKYWSGKKETTAISWEPLIADASKSADMGYSFGNWKYVTKDSTYYGNYYTFWKKHPDGTWKFVMDGGNNTPAPVK
jgi:ketosteroid isomerase-like protein